MSMLLTVIVAVIAISSSLAFNLGPPYGVENTVNNTDPTTVVIVSTLEDEVSKAAQAIGGVKETIPHETQQSIEDVGVLDSGTGNLSPTDIFIELANYAMGHGVPMAFNYSIEYLIKKINPAGQNYFGDETFRIEDIYGVLKDVNFVQIIDSLKNLSTKEGLSSALNRVNGRTVVCLWDTFTTCSKEMINPPALVYCIGKLMLGKGFACFPDQCTIDVGA